MALRHLPYTSVGTPPSNSVSSILPSVGPNREEGMAQKVGPIGFSADDVRRLPVFRVESVGIAQEFVQLLVECDHKCVAIHYCGAELGSVPCRALTPGPPMMSNGSLG